MATKAQRTVRRKKVNGWQRYLTTERVLFGGALLFTALFLVIIVVDGISKRPVSVNVDEVADNSVTFALQPADHIADGEMHPEYNSNPPTSGWHYAQDAQLRFYTDTIPDETLVHNLEHGQVWISFRDADDQDAIDALRDIQRQYPGTVIVTLRPENDSRIVAASWGRMLQLEALDTDQLYAYILRYRNQSPEPLAS